MPDHAHVLLSILRDPEGWPYELRSILQSLKSASAHSVNELLGTSGPVCKQNPSTTCSAAKKVSKKNENTSAQTQSEKA